MQSKSILKKLLIVVCSLVCLLALAFGLVACGEGTQGPEGPKGDQGPEGPKGDTGETGPAGVGIDEIEVVDGKIVITLTNGEEKTFDLPTAETVECEHANKDSWVLQEHSMKDNTVVNGVYLDVCEDCGYTWIVRDEARHNYEDITDSEATCTEPAYEGGQKCTICGNVIDAVAVGDPLGHAWDEGRLISAAGENVCEEGGRYIYMCTRDDCQAYYISEDLETRGHKVAEWSVTAAPTDKAPGVLTGNCTECGEEITLTLPTLTQANAGEGKAYTVTSNDPSCMEDTIYTYTYTMAVDAVTEIDSVAGLTTKTTVTYTGDAAFTWSDTVTVEGGNHYTLNWLGEEVPIEVDEIGDTATNVYNIDEYPDFKPIKNALGDDCQTTYNNGAYFICEHCGESIAVNVTGRHTYEGELKVTPADCTTPAHIDVECTTCDDVVTIWTDEDRALDEDNHVYTSEPTVVPNEDDPSKATITFTCANNPADDHKLVLENATLVGEPEVTYENGDPCMGKTYTKYTYEAEGEQYVVTITTPIQPHYVTAANGQKIELTDAQIAGTQDDPITNADAIITSPSWEFLKNVPQSCGDAATQCAYFVCECCGESYSVYYKPAHTAGETAKSEATCEKAAVYTCTKCGQDFEVGEPLGHDYVIKDGESFVYDPDAPADTQVSFTVVCTRDGSHTMLIEGTYADLIIDKVVQEQKCNQEGILDITFHASDKDYTFKNVNIGRLPHHYDGKVIDETHTTEYVVGTPGLILFSNAPANCGESVESGGYFVCEDCGDSISVRVKGPHTPGDAPVKVADHTTAAVYQCTECNDYYFVGTPVEHEWTVKDGSFTAPTDTQKGSITYECTCGETKTVELPVLTDAVWTKTTASNNCETGVSYRYTGEIKFPVEVTSTYTENGANLSQKDTFEYKETVTFTTDATDVGHDRGDEPVTYYEWVWPVGEGSVTYVGYICERCGQMIVVWETGDDAGDKPANTIVLVNAPAPATQAAA